jgi:Fe-S oxidoreductase
MLRGETISGGWRSDAVHEALDLCLSCKGCKGDCPVDVDMATYELSKAVYEHRLAGMVRDAGADTLLVADGFSCRTQMEQLGGRRALHLAEALASPR